MIANFRISEDDYVAAMKLFARPRTLRRALTVGVVALLVLYGFSIWRDSRPEVLGGFIGLAVVVVFMRFVASRIARSHYRKYRAMHGEFGAELLDTGLRLVSATGDSTLVWENVLKWRQDERFVLICPMPRLFHILPKSVAAQGFELPALLERLNRHVGPEV